MQSVASRICRQKIKKEKKILCRNKIINKKSMEFDEMSYTLLTFFFSNYVREAGQGRLTKRPLKSPLHRKHKYIEKS